MFITLLLDKGPLQRQDNLVRRSALGRWRISRSPWRRQRGNRALGGRLGCPAAGHRGTGERREGEQHLVHDPRRGLVAQGAGEVPAIKASTSHPRDQGMVAYWHVNCHNSKGILRRWRKKMPIFSRLESSLRPAPGARDPSSDVGSLFTSGTWCCFYSVQKQKVYWD